jgi:L-fuconolactonase
VTTDRPGAVTPANDWIDAHVHFWDPGALHYPWLAELPALERPFLPADYRAADDGRVARVVFVECNCLSAEAALEVAFVERLTRDEPRIAGVVAFADVAARGAAALDALPASPLVKGVRQNVQGHPAGWCLAPRFVEGVREAGARGLAFDLCATHDQLADVVALAERCPGTRLVLDHCGKPRIDVRDRPGIGAGVTEPWATHVASLGAMPHVSCKISGLLTEAPPGAADDALAPYASHAAAAFGPGRVLYGSDWPVVTLAGPLARWAAFVDGLTSTWTDGARRAFFRDNAVRVYAL